MTSAHLKKEFPEYQLHRIGQALRPSEKIKYAHDGAAISFSMPGPCSQEELREIIVYAAEMFLVEINALEDFMELMTHHPLTLKDLCVTVRVDADDGISQSTTTAQLLKGNVTYSRSEGSEKPTEWAREGYDVAFQTVDEMNAV